MALKLTESRLRLRLWCGNSKAKGQGAARLDEGADADGGQFVRKAGKPNNLSASRAALSLAPALAPAPSLLKANQLVSGSLSKVLGDDNVDDEEDEDEYEDEFIAA